MNLRWLASAFVAGAAALCGCGNPCVALCSDGKECPGADVAENCEDRCDSEKTTNESLNCLAEYEDYIDCQTGLDDVCTPGDQCADQKTKYDDCRTNACADKPDDPACK